jgi:uncharacterized membrane protein
VFDMTVPPRSARPVSIPADISLVPLLSATAAGALLAVRAGQQRPARDVLGVGALVLLALAARAPLSEVVRAAGTRRRAARLRMSFVIHAPVERVFAFCSDFENYPRFIGALRAVRDSGDGRSHWCASTPSGGELEWNAVTTKFVTNRVIGWRSVTVAPVEMTGLLRFSPEGAQTCVRVELDYRVLDGSLADAVASLIGARWDTTLRNEILSLESLLAAMSDPARSAIV